VNRSAGIPARDLADKSRAKREASPVRAPENATDAPPGASAGETPLANALATLQARGIITRPDYWLANARPGKTCSGPNVAKLITRAAAAQTPEIQTLEAACDHLAAAGLLDRPADWKKHAQKGKTCRGESVATLLARLAAKE
jgi:hypothetical protein